MLVSGKEMIFVIEGKKFHCSLDVTMNYIGGKWKTVVLWYLLRKTLRFSAIKKLIPSITEKTLSLQLKELERDGIVERTVYAEVPPRVEYALTEFGKQLIPIVEAMGKWGKQTGNKLGALVEVRKIKTPSRKRLKANG